MADSGPVFAGSIPANYNRYMVPMLFEAYARDIANRINVPNDGRVLELACGTGAVTKQLRASLANTVNIVATDLNPGMLAVAQEALGGEAAIEFKVADGTDLPFEDASFDALVCQFGVMFFPDKNQGFSEAARVLRPGGCLHFSVWDTIDHNGFSKLVHETAISVSPEITFMAMPFSFNDVSAIKTSLESAGFHAMDFSVQPRELRADNINDAVAGIVAGSPLAAEFEAGNLMEEGREAMVSAFKSKYGDGPILDTMQAIVIEATKPL
jgi:ubiquinone/menaquinone biosynthesis C-methylase UbiE